MITGDAIVLPPAALAEAKSYLRAAHAEEDALIAGLLRASAELCEQFTAQAVPARAFRETLKGGPGWVRLGRCPVRAITAVEEDGGGALDPSAYAIDIDADGYGWLRLASGARRVRVTYEAGLAAQWEDLPEPLRHGIVRLAAHLYASRTAGEERAPPAAVTALWRPWRRLRLG